MDREIVVIVASVFVVLALLANVYFIYRYARFSDWSGNPVGRTHMIRSGTMCAILLYAFVGRWLPVPDWVQDLLGLGVWVAVFFVEIRLTYTLVGIQQGKITLSQIRRNEE